MALPVGWDPLLSRGCGGGVVTTSKEKEKKPMIRKNLCLIALSGLFALAATGARADDTALLDVLVKKGILTKQEAEKLEAEVSKEPATTGGSDLGSRLKIGDWVQELDLYGDMRFRDYYQTFEQQNPTAGSTFDKNIQRQRIRFRLRMSP